ncbi:ABC transporter ATP-binding protein/permease [Clostridium estertheticum]|uniref:ABC transporter ATP-binding protein n=1 Tax=Clostridium estertheticum TaxID=238834 RepID=UPI001C0E5D4C|nr:ABC transporter ATP-binding protein [Clostridium estertheticum]MBU3198532.1 ABC transporter ATP-binding protein/permease [Clostridium estertheticum]WAG64512.1 ABC transporter ATP-binding protein/permease [Clostridium estertheticum]
MFNNFQKNEFKRMMALMEKREKLYITSLMTSCASYAAYQILVSFTNKNLVNSIIYGNKKLLLKASLIILIAMIIACVIDPIATYIFNSCIKKTMIETRLNIFSRIQKFPYSYFDSKHNGDIISVVSNDLNAMEVAYGQQMYRLMISILYGFGSLFSMIYLSWRLATITITLGFVLSIINIKLAKSLRYSSDKVQKIISNLTEITVDITLGLRVLRMSNLSGYFMNKFNVKNNNLYDAELERTKITSMASCLNFLLAIVNQMSIFCIGAFLVLLGKMDFGTILAIILLQNGITNMFIQVGNYSACLQTSLAGAHRVFELMDSVTPIKESIEENREFVDNNNIIVMKDITFGYKENRDIIKNINISIKYGETIGLTGKSGGGKSTILKLLIGLYKPQKGNIYIKGKSISKYSIQELRDLIAFVPQEGYLLDDTILENIRCGKIDATNEEIILAAKKAYAHDFIIEMEDGYETRVGENGSNLSVGQKQRVSIARAILKDAPIILLDEATSALDLESEQYVSRALNILIKGKTTIIVAHNLYTIENSEKIIVIENGKVIEEGTNEDFLNNEGGYRLNYISKRI